MERSIVRTLHGLALELVIQSNGKVNI